MNILLVKPRPHKDSINLQSFMLCEPLELEYAAALLERLGHRADLVDLVLERDFAAVLRAGDYRVVAFTAYQIHIDVVKEYARQVKDYDPAIVTLAGGVHAEVAPEDFESPFLDVVLTGGLYALEGVMEGRQIYQHAAGGAFLPVASDSDKYVIGTAAPILSEGDVMGCVLFVGTKEGLETSEVDYKLAQTVSGFLGRHMES